MEKIIYKLFVDGSVNPQKNIGFGAYLFCKELNTCKEQKIFTKKFEDTSSTKLEVQTFIWAVTQIDCSEKFIVYTDCQNILSLLNRREKLQNSNYTTKTGKKVKNEELYKEFFLLYDKYNFEIIKVKGHKKASTKDEIDDCFFLVDKESRAKLRNEIIL
ncbi:ribonuclease HI [Malaciobacter marinus]|uniref:Ribonuclease H n=1 Tax=Malaciobacter marinus TaxID=505249 RepID=A0A347TLF5_9BACT|nr:MULTISPECIES: RNase H family protein [Malaciobacter]AXX87433.1 ribonuclease H family protein [Malaciobacter marinus]PHO13691.1 ribonuclease H [Malaciobacter marinus]PHO16228.1 ribonuclease H [Malaciobacter marinus]RYA22307.1 ribonuclease H [Malaciobacter halophilus]